MPIDCVGDVRMNSMGVGIDTGGKDQGTYY